MQLKLSTDYAIRIILHLAKTGKVSSQELADTLNISQNYVRKMIRQPQMAEFITSSSGKNGGLSLKPGTETVSLLDIITAVEKSSFVSYCLEDEDHCNSCRSFDKQSCPIRKCYERIQRKLDKEFKETRIRELLREETCYKRREPCS